MCAWLERLDSGKIYTWLWQFRANAEVSGARAMTETIENRRGIGDEQVTVQLRVIEDQAGALEVREQLERLLADAFAEPPYDRSANEIEGMLRRFDRHARKPGFRLVLAVDRGKPVALAYGFRLPADTAWWSETLEPVPDEVAYEDGKRTFAVFELAVDPSRRREHLAARVHDALLAGRAEQRAVLNVRQDAKPAQAAYKAWGYRRVASLIPWDCAPEYDVMVRDLR